MTTAVNINTLWDFVNTTSKKVFDESKVIEIKPASYQKYVYMKFINEFEPESFEIDYVANDSIGFYLNNVQWRAETALKDTIVIDSSIILPHFSTVMKT